MAKQDAGQSSSVDFAAGIYGWLWPGAGHIAQGRKKRGVLVMFGVLFLFFTGILIGGVDVVDREEDHLWFLAQALNGPVAFGADYVNQGRKQSVPAVQRQSLAHVNEIGTLFVALAGLMNLVVILDALQPHHADLPERRGARA